MVCGKPVEPPYFFGEKKDMSVIFCEEHRNYCDNCEVKSCADQETCELLNG